MADNSIARMTWDHSADHDLLSCLIKVLNPTQDNLRSVMEEMHTLGYTCTVKAITQHLQKLRRKENAGANANDANDGAAVAPKTPRGRKPGKPAGTTGKSTGKRKTADDDSEGTPVKKRVKKETSVKQEQKEEDLDGGDIEYENAGSSGFGFA
ncbi:hypothetical protein QBC43DRAFT_288252 [Cladorrhinum sp. PSN259]|nr:hypothetical protein QBC43DRAFT_288252 [Cladorrhinum sp. PSN259]